MRSAVWVLVLAGCGGAKPADTGAIPAEDVWCSGEAARLGGAPFATLQDAVEAAASGDVIEVCPGTWGPVSIVDAELTMVGSGGPEAVVVDAAGEAHALRVWGGTVRVQGVTFTGAVEGGVVAEYATLDLVDVVVRDNRGVFGGGIGAAGGEIRATDVVVRDNVADVGGGVGLIGAALRGLGGLEITGNTATRGGGVAGQALDDVTPSVVEGASIVANDADLGGGASYEGSGRYSTLELYDVELGGNSARLGGGAYQVSEYGDALGARVWVHDNLASEDGGGVYAGSSAKLEDWSFDGNQAGDRGGALFADGWWLSGEGVWMWDNVAPHGGAVFVAMSGYLTLDDLDLSGNMASDVETLAGDVLTWDATATVLVCDGGTCEIL